jgi:hypothetical protein
MGNYALLLVLAAAVAASVSLHSSRMSAAAQQRKLANHVNKSITAREAAITGLNLTVRRLAADTARWTLNPSQYEFENEPYRRAMFTTSVLDNYPPGPLLDECAIDTVDVVSTGFPNADSSGFRKHRIEATYVRTCAEAIRTRNWSSFNLGGYGWTPDTTDDEPEYDTVKVAAGINLLSQAEW